jgi:hypothetical protein
VADSTHRRRFKEYVLPVHASLYIMGQARERRDVVAAEIARSKNAPIFVISMKTEKQLSAGYVWWIWMWIILGLLCAGGGAFFVGNTGPVQSWQPFLAAFGIYFIAFAAGGRGRYITA